LTDKKAELYRCGKELFRSKGFKDTNIAEITKMAGMATGTFYNYYPSKDKLFMEIYIEENIKLKKSIMESIDMEAGPVTVMKEMISKNLQGMNAHPILKQWYNREVFNRIEQCYREENGSDYVDFLYYGFLDVVRKWQEEGKMRSDLSAEMIMAIFGAIVSVDTHKEEIGLQYFPQIMDYLGEFTMKGLTDCTASG
jgi:AcrR family transcriptional regulator